MGKKTKKRNLKPWPDDNEVVEYDELVEPLRDILYEGYELNRTSKAGFRYVGYNIGAGDTLYNPTPEERFSERWLSNDKKFGRTLIDNIFETIFQLGIEYGRRLIAPLINDSELYVSIADKQSDYIRFLEERLAKYEPNQFGKSSKIPLVSDVEFLIEDSE